MVPGVCDAAPVPGNSSGRKPLTNDEVRLALNQPLNISQHPFKLDLTRLISRHSLVILSPSLLVILSAAKNLLPLRTGFAKNPSHSSGRRLEILRRPNKCGLLRMTYYETNSFTWIAFWDRGSSSFPRSPFPPLYSPPELVACLDSFFVHFWAPRKVFAPQIV